MFVRLQSILFLQKIQYCIYSATNSYENIAKTKKSASYCNQFTQISTDNILYLKSAAKTWSESDIFLFNSKSGNMTVKFLRSQNFNVLFESECIKIKSMLTVIRATLDVEDKRRSIYHAF